MPEARSVVVRLSADTAAYIRDMQKAGKLGADAMTQVETRADRSGRAMDSLGSKAGKVGLAAATGLGLAAKAAIDWESAWAGVTKTVDGTTEQLADLEGELRELARTMPATHAEIAAVAEAAGQLGVAREDITSFTTTMIQLGETTNLSADQAATSIAQLQNVMGTAPEDIDNLGAALVALGNDGASTEDQIIQMAQRISGAAETIGLAESEVLAIANTVASAGIEVEAGGSSVSRVLGTLAKAVAEGGAKLDAFARTSGQSSEDFVKAFGEDPASAFASFIAGLEGIRAEGGNVYAILKDLGFSDIRVSDALLRMSSNSDLLTDSLALGAEAWSENTALTDEYGKRVDTTAAQVQIAWNNIKDAGIEAGAALLPIISEVADVVSTLARAFGELPDPVQSAFVKLAAITALVGGAAWFGAKVVGAITSTKAELAALGTTADGTKTKLARIGGTATAILAVGTAVGAIADGIGRIEASNIDRALQGLSLGGDPTKDIRQVVEDIGDLTSNWNKVDLGEVVTVGGLFGDTSLDRMADNVNQVDEALAGMVENGNAEGAAEIMARIIELAKEQGTSADRVSSQFDNYSLALENVALESGTAAGASEDLAASAAEAASESAAHAQALQAEAEALAAATEEMEKLREERLKAINAELAYSGALLDTRDFLEDHGRVLEGLKRVEDAHTRTQIEAVGVLNSQAAAWNDLDAAAQAAPGAFEEARRSLIRSARQLGLNGKAAEAYADAVLEIPPEAVTDVELNVNAAKEALRQWKKELDNLDGRTIKTFAKMVVLGPSGAPKTNTDPFSDPGLTPADGATVPGRRYPYGDRVPALLAPGEEVISNRYGQADRNRGLLKRINANRLADGGTIGYADGGTVAGKSGDGLTKLEREAGKAADRLAEEREERKALVEELRNERREIVQSIAARFRENPFDDTGIWGANSGFMGALKTDITEARASIAATAKLRKKGLSGGALAYLAQNADLPTIQALAGSSRSTIDAFEDRYRTRQRVSRLAGAAVGDAVVGRELAAAVRSLEAVMKGPAARAIGKAVGEEINDTAARAGRRG